MLAEDQVDYVTQIVKDKLAAVFKWAESARAAAQSAINAIGAFPVPMITMNAPDAPGLAGAESPGAGDAPNTKVGVSPKSVSYIETGQIYWAQPSALPDLKYGVAVA